MEQFLFGLESRLTVTRWKVVSALRKRLEDGCGEGDLAQRIGEWGVGGERGEKEGEVE